MKQNQANQAVTVNVSVTVNVNVTVYICVYSQNN